MGHLLLHRQLSARLRTGESEHNHQHRLLVAQHCAVCAQEVAARIIEGLDRPSKCANVQIANFSDDWEKLKYS